jgi:vitamin-K-epoxide reductase (warfarin-sensitive)
MLRVLIVILATLGSIDAALALRVHYSDETQPCYVNQKWDCGIVNHSMYAEIGHVPVAGIGVAGYVLLALLAIAGRSTWTVGAALAGEVYALYLAHIERDVIHMWCLYCVISLGIMSATLATAVIWALVRRAGARHRGAHTTT